MYAIAVTIPNTIRTRIVRCKGHHNNNGNNGGNNVLVIWKKRKAIYSFRFRFQLRTRFKKSSALVADKTELSTSRTKR